MKYKPKNHTINRLVSVSKGIPSETQIKSKAYPNTRLTLYCIICFAFCNCFLWLQVSMLLLLPLDIRLNPDTSLSSYISSYDLLSNHLYCTLIPKIDIFRCGAQTYDVLVLSERWLKPQISNNSILINILHHIIALTGGGIIMYVQDILTFKSRQNLEAV